MAQLGKAMPHRKTLESAGKSPGLQNGGLRRHPSSIFSGSRGIPQCLDPGIQDG